MKPYLADSLLALTGFQRGRFATGRELKAEKKMTTWFEVI